MIFRAHKYQPLLCWVDLHLSNLDQYFLKEPEVLIDASFEFEGLTTVGIARINLFDDIAILVEKSIFEVTATHDKVDIWGVPIGTIQWGYSINDPDFPDGEYSSPLYEFILIRYTMSMGREYFTMSMEARITNHESLTTHSKIEGTIGDCFTQYCDIYDLDLVIAPPIDPTRLVGVWSSDDTRYHQNEEQNDTRTSDFEFIRDLAYKCVDKDGIGGYDVYYDPTSRTAGKKGTLYIYNIKGAKELTVAIDNYVVRDSDSVVIEWSPTIEYSTPLSSDKRQVVQRGVQSYTGSTVYNAVNNHLISDKIPNIGGIDIQKNLDDFWNGIPMDNRYKEMVGYAGEMEILAQNDSMNKITPMATSEPVMSMNKSLSKFIAGSSGLYQASLTIEGDPKFILPKVIQVTYTLPHSYKWETSEDLHYSTGIYMVTSITHNVGSGGYSSSLQLRRNMIDIPEKGVDLPEPTVKKEAS